MERDVLDTTLADDVINFVAEYTGCDKSSLALNSRLNHDLRVDGIDGESLLLQFAEKFHVDLTGIDVGKYFDPEPHLFNFIAWIWMWRYARGIPSPHDPLTIADLIEAARLKHWAKTEGHHDGK